MRKKSFKFFTNNILERFFMAYNQVCCVDVENHLITVGGLEISFYTLENGDFVSLASYSRKDDHPNWDNDLPLIRQAYECLAQV
jgi:hypothetical protein